MKQLITIVTIRLDWHPQSGVECIMIMEVIGDEPQRFYMAGLPALDYTLKKQLRYYKKIMN